ncbi:hypothetical protein [Paenibacillus segetis]|uniref:Uncharacterized protein n=1 Tax=Paenibacillus segetis TaxID=1325360 RepID=A0ABQ1Y8K7_9BACL|nr:hypothetical protein [Paenibacillus segetis]GGH15450.1 hypothetical protein GCM10008013_09660 [Paenibacillus segetis]
MGQHRIRKRRRRRFHKPDVAVSILACLTIILLFVWGGLYWKESSEKMPVVNASVQDQTEPPLMQGENGLPIKDEEYKNTELVDTLQAIEEVEDHAGNNADELAENQETSQTEAASDSQAGKMNKPNAIDNSAKPDSSSSSLTKPETKSSTKPNESEPTKTGPLSSMKPDEQEQNLVESDSTGSLVTGTPSVTPTAPAVSKVEKYEEEFTKIQGKCTKDMKAVLSGAESNAQQLDKRDPRVVLAWRDNLNAELATAESTCEGTFQGLIQTAENEQVSDNAIEKWKQTYTDLKVKLREESEAKLKELMGG